MLNDMQTGEGTKRLIIIRQRHQTTGLYSEARYILREGADVDGDDLCRGSQPHQPGYLAANIDMGRSIALLQHHARRPIGKIAVMRIKLGFYRTLMQSGP